MPQSTRSVGNESYVTVSPIGDQTITLPDKFFVSPADPEARRSVPSLSFLITHHNPPRILPPPLQHVSNRDEAGRKPIHILFDLGLRKTQDLYLRQQQQHLSSRQPYQLQPSVAETLRDKGPTRPEDIHLVVLSHVHYDHHGDPYDYPNAHFIVGPGALKVLKEGLGGVASHQHFDPDLLPLNRTTELPPTPDTTIPINADFTPTESAQSDSSPSLRSSSSSSSEASTTFWHPLRPFPHTHDLLSDGSLILISAPGHLPGHLNLLARTGPERWVYLAGDSAHDTRLLTGEKEIGTWRDGEGRECCIHLDRTGAEETLGRIGEMVRREGRRVEIVLAHDEVWRDRARQEGRMYPGKLE